MKDKLDSFSFSIPLKPDLVNVDGDKVLVAAITDHKSLDDCVFQYFHAPLYADRLQALDAAIADPSDARAQKIMIAAMNDRYFGLQIDAISALDMNDPVIRTTASPRLVQLARTDTNHLVRAAALNVLGKLRDPNYLPVFKEALLNESPAVQSAARTALDLPGPRR